MRKRFPFAPFLPDMPPSGQCIVASNVLPVKDGYGSVRSFKAITPALPGICGGAAYVGSDGTTAFLAGDHNALYRYSGSTWSSVFVAVTAGRWRFAQYGDLIPAVHGGAPIKFNLLTGAATLIGGSPPDCDMVATVRDFAVVAGDPAHKARVSWSGFNNLDQWTPLTNQAGNQDMLDGGEVMGLAGGEYGIVLQRNALKRMSYVGTPLVWQFDAISTNIGCMAKGSVAQAGRLVFFLSERGFQVCDGNDVTPIGAEQVDRTFFASYSRQDIEAGLYAAVDPRRNVVLWSMPGRPGRAWCYNWSLQRWSTIDVDLSLVFSGFTANVSIDALDGIYGNLDAVPGSLDDATYSGGNPLLLVATSAGIVGSFAGDPMTGSIGLARTELAEGRARLRTMRPVTDAPIVTATVGGSPRADNMPLNEAAATMRNNGDIPTRVNARYFTPLLNFSGLWTYATGVDLEWEDGGRR